MDFLNKFRTGLLKTSNFLTANIVYSLSSKKISSEILADIETALISADISLSVTNHLIDKIKKIKISDQADTRLILDVLAKEITEILLNSEKNIIEDSDISPTVFLFIGVNGSGKTTTIGKLINRIGKNNKTTKLKIMPAPTHSKFFINHSNVNQSK